MITNNFMTTIRFELAITTSVRFCRNLNTLQNKRQFNKMALSTLIIILSTGDKIGAKSQFIMFNE